MSDDEQQSPTSDNGTKAQIICETSPFLPRSTKAAKSDSHSPPGVDHADDSKPHIPIPSSFLPAASSYLETVEEAMETPTDLTNSVLDQLRDLRAGAAAVVESVTGKKQ